MQHHASTSSIHRISRHKVELRACKYQQVGIDAMIIIGSSSTSSSSSSALFPAGIPTSDTADDSISTWIRCCRRRSLAFLQGMPSVSSSLVFQNSPPEALLGRRLARAVARARAKEGGGRYSEIQRPRRFPAGLHTETKQCPCTAR